jgi:hypothetical protein
MHQKSTRGAYWAGNLTKVVEHKNGGLADFAEMTPTGGTARSYPSKTVPRQPTNATRSRPCPPLSHRANAAAMAGPH